MTKRKEIAGAGAPWMDNQSQKPMQISQVPSAGNKISELSHHLIGTQG